MWWGTLLGLGWLRGHGGRVARDADSDRTARAIWHPRPAGRSRRPVHHAYSAPSRDTSTDTGVVPWRLLTPLDQRAVVSRCVWPPTSGLASSRETAAAWLSHLNWLFSGKGVAEAQTSSHLLQKLSRIGANLLRCLAVQVTIGSRPRAASTTWKPPMTHAGLPS